MYCRYAVLRNFELLNIHGILSQSQLFINASSNVFLVQTKLVKVWILMVFWVVLAANLVFWIHFYFPHLHQDGLRNGALEVACFSEVVTFFSKVVDICKP